MNPTHRPTHLLDGRESVGRPRSARHLLDPRQGNHRPYPHIDRNRARTYGLYLVHREAAIPGDYHGDLLVTGDRLDHTEP